MTTTTTTTMSASQSQPLQQPAASSAIVKYESQLLGRVNAALQHRAAYHTVAHLVTTITLLAVALSIGVYSLLFSARPAAEDDTAVLQQGWTLSSVIAQLTQSALSTLALLCLLIALHGIYQYYRPLPALQSLTPAQRQLLGLDTLSQTNSQASPEAPTTRYDYLSGAISSGDSLSSLRKRNKPTDDQLKHAHTPTPQQQQQQRTVIYTDPRSLLRSPQTANSSAAPTTPMQLRTPNRNSAISPYTTTVTSPATITSARELQQFITEQQHQQHHQQHHNSSSSQHLQLPGQQGQRARYGSNMSLSPYNMRSASFGQPLNDTPLYSTSIRETTPSLLSHSSPSTSGSTTIGKFDLSDPQSDAESIVLAEQLLISLKLTHTFHLYCQNARRWGADHVIRHAYQEIAVAMTAMHQLAQLAVQHDANGLNASEKTMLLDFQHHEDEACVLLSTRYANQPAVEQYKAVQHWLNVHATMMAQASTPATPQQQHPSEVTPLGVRQYVRHRLAELAASDNLSAYRHDGGTLGSGPHGSQLMWTSALPTDAHIVCHCFITHMSQIIPAFDRYFYTAPTQHPHGHQSLMHLQSSSQHRHRRHASSLTGKLYPAHATLVQTRPPTLPPYYLLTHHKHSSHQGSSDSGFASPHSQSSAAAGHVVEWRAEPGRNNLFAAIALFVYYIERFADGKIGNTPLNSLILDGLDRVVKVA